MARKNFATMDKHRTDSAQSAFARRFDHSRVVPFQAELSKLTQNPRNPRYPDDPKVQELAKSFEAVGQLQTAVALTRDTFLEAYPDEEERVPEAAEWVTFMGNRRLAAAELAGWTSLEVVLAQDVADAQAIEDRIIHENIHREGLPPLLEAEMYVRKMEREKLSARELAEAIGKSHTYVNQRLSLRDLIPEFQAKLKSGELGIKDARRIAPLDDSEQCAVLEIWPALNKLVPGYQALFHAGALPQSEVEQLANLSANEQRAKLAELPRGGNPVSTPGEHSTEEGKSATPPEPAQTKDDGHQEKGKPAGEGKPRPIIIRIAERSPSALAGALRKEFTADEIGELVRALTDNQ